MLIKVNDKNEIAEYADVGGLDGAQEFKGDRPVDFAESFKPSYYLLQNEEIIVNPNYQEPSISIPVPEQPSSPSPEMLAINALGIQLAKHLAGGD